MWHLNGGAWQLYTWRVWEQAIFDRLTKESLMAIFHIIKIRSSREHIVK